MLPTSITEYSKQVRIAAAVVIAICGLFTLRFLLPTNPPTLQYLVRASLVAVAGAVLVVLQRQRRRRDRRQLDALLATRDANEAALRASEQQMRLFFENTPDLVYRLNADDIYVSISPSVRRYGYEPEEMIGQHGSAPAADLERWKQIMKERDRRGGLDDRDIEFRARDGRLVTLAITSRAIRGSDGQLVGWHGIARDVTERRRLTEDLVRSQRQAEAASRAKSDFIANISHEIRNPLAGTLGMLEILLETELSPPMRGWAEAAKDSADTLAMIVDNVLDLAKIEAHAIQLEAVEFSLIEVLRPTIRTHAVHAHQKGLEFFYRPAVDLPHRLVGDPTRLRQVVSNLLGNALKFTRSGSISVSVDAERRPGRPWLLRVDVADTGMGIAADQRRAIFGRFVQADVSVTREHGGAGLGLPICIELARLMNGGIWVESEVDKGSTFHFTAELAGSEASVVASSRELGGFAVLLVSLRATLCEVVDLYLRHWGGEVEIVGDATTMQARLDLSRARARPYDLILIDGDLEGALELARAHHAAAPEGRAPILPILKVGRILSEWPLWEGIAAGRYVENPIDPEDLHRTLGTLTRLPSVPTMPPSVAADGALRVLLAEDSETVQAVVAAQLRKRNCDVTVVSNGKQAVEAVAQRARFDLILLDVQMPIMNGVQAARAIRGLERSEDVPALIVALTGQALAQEQENCRAAGMNEHLVKPVRAADLAGLVERLNAQRVAPPTT